MIDEVERLSIWLWRADETFGHWLWGEVSDIRKDAYRRMARALISEGFVLERAF